MAKKKLLVVDDDPQTCDLYEGIFQAELEVVRANSGDAAIREAILQRPDCILLDVMMPDMGGYVVLEILKSMQQTKLVPVIIVSGKAREEAWKVAQEIGAFDYLRKPSHVKEARHAVYRALRVAPRERRRASRVAMKMPVVVRGRDEAGRAFEFTGHTVNVSRFGALIAWPTKIPPGSLIDIHKTAGAVEDGRRAESIAARVVWIDPAATAGPYHHGIEFLSFTANWVVKL